MFSSFFSIRCKWYWKTIGLKILVVLPVYFLCFLVLTRQSRHHEMGGLSTPLNCHSGRQSVPNQMIYILITGNEAHYIIQEGKDYIRTLPKA